MSLEQAAHLHRNCSLWTLLNIIITVTLENIFNLFPLWDPPKQSVWCVFSLCSLLFQFRCEKKKTQQLYTTMCVIVFYFQLHCKSVLWASFSPVTTFLLRAGVAVVDEYLKNLRQCVFVYIFEPAGWFPDVAAAGLYESPRLMKPPRCTIVIPECDQTCQSVWTSVRVLMWKMCVLEVESQISPAPLAFIASVTQIHLQTFPQTSSDLTLQRQNKPDGGETTPQGHFFLRTFLFSPSDFVILTTLRPWAIILRTNVSKPGTVWSLLQHNLGFVLAKRSQEGTSAGNARWTYNIIIQ